MYKLIIFFLLYGVFTSLAQVNLDSGLVARYPFNGNANDESGNEYHGTVFGATLTEDRFGNVNNAYSFNSANQDYIRVADHPQLRLSSQLTLSVWINHSSTATPFEDIVMKGNNSYGFQFNSNNAQVLFHLTSNGWRNLNSNFVPVTDEWCHLAGTYDGSVQKVFINGILTNYSTWSGGVQTNTDPLDFGFKVAYDNNWYQGKIDDIRIYNRALTEEEIFALFYAESPVTVSSPNLISPENQAFNSTLNPMLQWGSVQNASSYTLQVSTNVNFTSFVLNESGIEETEFQLNDLELNTTYYWRVRASDGAYSSYWSEVWSFTTSPEPMSLNLDLISGWNLISSNILPIEPAMETLFNETENLVIVKNNLGHFFFPVFGINQIGSWDISQGYYVYVTSPSNLQIEGISVNPLETAIDLNQGWNLVSYLRNSEMLAPDALQGISGSILFAKDKTGYLYHPDFGINDLGSMLPGKGYWIYMNAPAVLTYPGN